MFDESPGEEKDEKMRLSAEKGLASTQLSQLISKNRLISQSCQITLWETGGFQKALYQHVDMVT